MPLASFRRGFTPARRNGMHLSGRFVKSNDCRLSGLRPRGAVLDSHACASYVRQLCAAVATSHARQLRQLCAPVMCARYMRQPRRAVASGNRLVRRRLPEKAGREGQQRVPGGLNAAGFREARCAASNTNSIGRRYFGKPGEKKPELRRTVGGFRPAA
ncbi:protein of unknown function [Desulfovibrio sp. 86]|nr:protein of unknown function [Desulfovibrio sp. 86]